MGEGSLKNRTVKGVSWSFVDSILNQGVTFVVGLVLARILSPAEYGLIGIVLIFIAIFNSIVNSGFSQALIRKKDASSSDYNTAFMVNMAISIVMMIVLYFSAPSISAFFKQPQLLPLARVMSVIIIINAFALVQRTRLIKNIDFKSQAKISLVASLSSGILGIVMALNGYGVWALAAQQISRSFVNTVLLWFLNRWIPRMQFSIASFRELFGFGWKMMVSGLINTVWKEIYQIVIGKFYSAYTLGQYTRASQFSSIFSSNITGVIQRVSYPVLSSIKDDNEKLKRSYKKIIKTTMLVTFVCMFGLAAIAKPMILVLIGEKWLLAVTFLQIISMYMMLYPLHALNLNMLQVFGRSDLFLKLEIIKKAIAVIPILLGIFIDIYYMLFGSLITSYIAYYLNAYYSGKSLGYSMKEQIVDIMPSFFIALIMAVPLFLMSFISISPYVLLPLQIIVGASIVYILCEKMQREEYLEFKHIAVAFYNKMKQSYGQK